jgi:hypothetical protein
VDPPDVRYTRVAAKAVNLAELFEEAFASGLDGPVRYRIAMSAPEGPSTAGGKQALQHIKLIPARGGPTIVIGAANTIKQTAELRTYALLADLHAQRFKGAALPLQPGQYKELFDSMMGFFEAMRLQVSTADLTRSARPAPALGSESSAATWLAILVAVSVLAAAAWIVLSHLHR